MRKLVFLVEEPSMADLLDGLLPRLFPALRFQCIPHDGKQDLERSIPRKLRAWREPGVRFVVARDQDSADCRRVKENLAMLCRNAGRPDTLVRVVCRELEAWYVGDPQGLVQAFPESRRRPLRELNQARYRDPDTVVRPSEAIAKQIPEFQKRLGGKAHGELPVSGEPFTQLSGFPGRSGTPARGDAARCRTISRINGEPHGNHQP